MFLPGENVANEELPNTGHLTQAEVPVGMDAPTRNGINVPKWKCLATT